MNVLSPVGKQSFTSRERKANAGFSPHYFNHIHNSNMLWYQKPLPQFNKNPQIHYFTYPNKYGHMLNCIMQKIFLLDVVMSQ